MFVCFRHDFLRCCLPILLKKQHFVDFRTIIYVLFAVCSSTLYRLSAFAIRRLQVDNCNNRDWSTIIRMLQRFLYRRRSPPPGFVIGILPGTVHVHKVKQVQDYEGEYVDIERNSERISGSYFALNLYRTAGDTTCVTHECFNPIKILTIAQRCEINFISLWESTWYFKSVARTFSVQILLWFHFLSP